MSPDLQTSFIPKQTAPLAPLEPRRKPLNIFMLAATVIFVAGLGASGWVFGYKIYLGKSNDALAAELTRLKPDESAIEELKHFNQRVDTGGRLLSSHTTLVPLFALLEQSTLQNVRFKTMTYQNNADTRSVTLQLTGEAKNYEAVALQSDAFGATGGIKNAVFSGLGFDAQSKNINFTVNAVVDVSYLSFSKNLPPAAAAGQSPANGMEQASPTNSATSTGSSQTAS